MVYTTHYMQIAIQIAFNKQICMLIYVNQNNREKMKFLKTNLNIKNININIKHLRKINRSPQKTFPPGNQAKKYRTLPGIYY